MILEDYAFYIKLALIAHISHLVCPFRSLQDLLTLLYFYILIENQYKQHKGYIREFVIFSVYSTTCKHYYDQLFAKAE